jgi:hypothetical protein
MNGSFGSGKFSLAYQLFCYRMILADLDHPATMIPVDPGITDIGYDKMASIVMR